MIVRDIQHIFDSWAPKEIAWDRDNVGLQVGSSETKVRKIMVTLDVTEDVINEARQKKVDLLVSHHPLFFDPIRSLTDKERVGRLALMLARNGIALYSAHTNLDFTEAGVSVALARRLKLKNLKVLAEQQGMRRKIVVFVPPDHIENVMSAMSAAGAGKIGMYESCSFRSEGTGTFRAMKGSSPFIGNVGSLEKVNEIRLEMIVSSWKIDEVLSAMKKSHPYEEVAYDIYPLENSDERYGAGIIGDAKVGLTLQSFLKHVQRSLGVKALRYAGNKKKIIRTVAVCGGSGSDLLNVAIKKGADMFITADIKYHTFQEAEGQIALVDAGHFETEVPIIEQVVEFLKMKLAERGTSIAVVASQRSSNPVQYFLS